MKSKTYSQQLKIKNCQSSCHNTKQCYVLELPLFTTTFVTDQAHSVNPEMNKLDFYQNKNKRRANLDFRRRCRIFSGRGGVRARPGASLHLSSLTRQNTIVKIKVDALRCFFFFYSLGKLVVLLTCCVWPLWPVQC